MPLTFSFLTSIMRDAGETDVRATYTAHRALNLSGPAEGPSVDSLTTDIDVTDDEHEALFEMAERRVADDIAAWDADRAEQRAEYFA